MPQCGCRRAEAPRPSTDPVPDEGRSMNSPLKGHPSTHGDSYQLNTTNLFRQAVVTHPEQEIHHRDGDGQWRTTTYAATWTRIERTAHALDELGVQPGQAVGLQAWIHLCHFELYWALPASDPHMLQTNTTLHPNYHAHGCHTRRDTCDYV